MLGDLRRNPIEFETLRIISNRHSFTSAHFRGLLLIRARKEICMEALAAVKCGKAVVTLGEVVFSANFDSGNLDRAEECESSERDVLEYNLWLASDCAGTEYQNSNRTWFYFSVTIPPNYNKKVLRLNILNMNRQARLYHQGLTPIIKVVPGRGQWERLKENVECEMCDENLKLSFTYTVADIRKHTVFFAFCYPFSYTESQKRLTSLSEKFGCPCTVVGSGRCPDDQAIYYHREHLCDTLEGRRVDLITVSSHHGMRVEREVVLPGLFPDASSELRPRVFDGKKVVFISSRVHPGETPSSHVFNGFLGFLLRTDDVRSQLLRQHFVFKLVPMLNPDGVFRGHYRTDSRGVNLNRVYLEPNRELHPSVYAVKQLFLHYHGGGRACPPDPVDKGQSGVECIDQGAPVQLPPNIVCTPADSISDERNLMTSSSKTNVDCSVVCHSSTSESNCDPAKVHTLASLDPTPSSRSSSSTSSSTNVTSSSSYSSSSSSSSSVTSPGGGIAVYVDLHAHATKRGCFLYGNHFADEVLHAESMLFPRLVSLNSTHMDFDHCVFSEKNMYAADKRTGQSKEGSGRVALHQATGVVHSYTLECNYNSGRRCNGKAPVASDDSGRASPAEPPSPFPHKYSIEDFEEVGRSLGAALLDLYGLNPLSRLPNTEFGSLDGVRASLQEKVRAARAKAEASKAGPDKDGSKVCMAFDEEPDQSEMGPKPTEDQPSPTESQDQPPTGAKCFSSVTSRLCNNPSCVQRTLNSKKIEERRLELRQQIKAAKIGLRLSPGTSSSLLPRTTCTSKGVAVKDVKLPTEAAPGTSYSDSDDRSKEKTFWVSLSAPKTFRKKRNDCNFVMDNSLSVTGVCVTRQQQQETKQPAVRKKPNRLLPRRASEKNSRIKMAIHLPMRPCSDGELK